VPLSWNLWTLTSWNPLGHSRPVTGLLHINFLEPSGPLQACNGTALPLPLPFLLPCSCRQGMLHHTHWPPFKICSDSSFTNSVTFRGTMDEVNDFFSLHDATAPSWPGPHYRGSAIKLWPTTLGRNPLDDRTTRCRNYLRALTRDRRPSTRRDSNSLSQQASSVVQWTVGQYEWSTAIRNLNISQRCCWGFISCGMTLARSVGGLRRYKSETPPTLEDEGMAFPPNFLSHLP